MVILWQLVHFLILWWLEFYPYPELVIYPYLRTLGWLPYTQILDQHFPGIMFFKLNLNSLGFSDPIALQLLLVLVVLVQSALIYKIARHWIAVFLFSLWQPFFEGQQLWIDTMLAIFTLPAWLFFQRKKWFLAGLCLGVGVVFKQTLIPLVVFAGIYLLIRYRKSALPILFFWALGSTLPSLLMLAYLVNIGVWSDFWYWTVAFNLTAYVRGGSLAPTINQWLKLTWPLLVIGLAGWRLKHLRLLIGWLLASVVGGIARFGFVHLQPAVPFLCVLYSALVRDTWRKSRLGTLALLLPSLIWFGWFMASQTAWRSTRFYGPADMQLASEISSRTQPGDHIFLLGVNPHLYQLTQTVPAGGVFVFQFPWFLQVAGERVLAGIKNDPPRLIVYDTASNTDGRYLKDYANYLVDYTITNYQPVEQIGAVTVYASRY